MKTLVLSMISIAATVAAMTACTSEGDPIDVIDNGQPVEIKASAGIGEITTKTAGVIIDGNEVNDIEFIITEGESAPTDWSTAPLVKTSASIGTDKSLSFSPKQYYNSKPSINSYLIGYHPKSLGNAVRTNNSVAYVITGDEDIMCTEVKNGNKTTNKNTNLEITFDHLLTQYTFEVVAADAQAIQTWGKIRSIELIGQQKNATLALDKKTLVFNGNSDGIIEVGSTETDLKADLTATQFGKPIMVKPDQTNMQVKVVTENNSEGVVVDLTVASVKSTSYIVTLTFKATEIGATATIGEWKTGTGTGDVE